MALGLAPDFGSLGKIWQWRCSAVGGISCTVKRAPDSLNPWKKLALNRDVIFQMAILPRLLGHCCA